MDVASPSLACTSAQAVVSIADAMVLLTVDSVAFLVLWDLRVALLPGCDAPV
jgi:hypothetical protein